MLPHPQATSTDHGGPRTSDLSIERRRRNHFTTAPPKSGQSSEMVGNMNAGIIEDSVEGSLRKLMPWTVLVGISLISCDLLFSEPEKLVYFSLILNELTNSKYRQSSFLE